MCALFSKTHPPDFSIKEWELGISKSLSDLLTLRISKGFIIREHTEYRNHLISGCGYINAKKKFKGGFTIQLINSVHPKNNRCDIFFIGFNEDYVIQAMNNNFVYLGTLASESF